MKSVNKPVIVLILMILPLAVILFSLFIGRYPVAPAEAAQVLRCKLTGSDCFLPDTVQTVVWDIRLPRILLGAMVGGSLAVSGAAFQGLFRNPP